MVLRKSFLIVMIGCLIGGSPIIAGAGAGAGIEIELGSKKVYFLKDYQYFKPMIANVRTSQNHLRMYWGRQVGFTNSTKDGKHLFIDPSFGGSFPVFGFNKNEINKLTIPMRIPGIAVYVDGSAHLLLDMNTASRDVINTDYRFGFGLVGRAPKYTFISARGRLFHESTHIGDEYTLYASKQSAFRRYNVSYEAYEVFLALDHNYIRLDSDGKKLIPASSWLSYTRAYVGWRHRKKADYEGFTGLFEPSEPIILTGKDDWEFGGEVYFRGAEPVEMRPDACWCSKLVSPQKYVIALDFSRDDQLKPLKSERIWSTNLVFGFIYGDFLGIEKGNTVRWQLSFYNGVNPHGQFRTEKTSYYALDYIIDF